MASSLSRCSVTSQGIVSRDMASFLPRQFLGGSDIPVLGALVASTEQDDHRRAALDEIDPVAGTIVDPKLADALSDRANVAGVAERQAADADVDPGLSLPIAELVEPLGIDERLADFDHEMM